MDYQLLIMAEKRSIKKFLFEYKGYLSIFVISSILSTIITTIIPIYNGKFIDALIGSNDFDEILQFIIIIIPLSLIGSVLQYASNIYSVKLSSASSFDDLSNEVKHIQKIPYDSFISKFNPAYLVKRLSIDLETVYNFVIGNVVSIPLQAAVFCFSIAVIASISYQILAVSILFLPIYVVCYALLKKPLFDRGVKLKEEQSQLYKVVNDEVANIQDIKVNVSFDSSSKRRQKSFRSYYSSLISYSKIKYVFSSLDNIVGIIFQSLILILSGILIINGEMTVGQFTIINSYFYLLITAVKYYFNLGKSYQDYQSSMSRLNEIDSIEEEKNGNIHLDTINNIEVTKITYRYPNSGMPAVSDFSANFEKDNITWISGPNGSGKTTLLNILLGIVQRFESGDVKYADLNISDVDVYSARTELFSVLLQNGYSGDSTVRELIDEQLKIQENEVPSLVSLMGLDDLLMTDKFRITDHLDKKFDELSGGEKQRVRLFLTLGKQKPIIVLDEPNNALDERGIEALLQYLNKIKKGRIIIVVSHDRRISAIADKKIEMIPHIPTE